MRKVSVLERNYCPLSSGMSVRFKTESLSVLLRNECPLCSGITVRFRPEWVSGLLRILHRLMETGLIN